MYTKSSAYYDRYYSFKDWDCESNRFVTLIKELAPNASTVLELACGTGQFLKRFSEYFRVEGVDINEEFVNVARQRVPSAVVHVARMEDFSLNRKYDVVACLFSSIAYAKNREGLNKTLFSVSQHLSSNGVVLIEPWFTPEEFWVGHTKLNVIDDNDLKIVCIYVQERAGMVALLDMNFLVADQGKVHHFSETHELGLFSQEDFRIAFHRAGLTADFRREGKHGLFVGRRPTSNGQDPRC